MRLLVMICWAFIGLVLGGLIGGELADLSANHRGDIGRIAVGGVVLGLMSSCALGFVGYALALKLSNYPQKLAKWTAAGLMDKSQPHAAAVSNASGLTPPRWL